ncbi:cardiolipin synthase [Puniceicoccales bacterium CK1056]|uniref:Cardiolipin synthase n=1 Tax=Oceanipulchritudo coccoides TaxID=2706888 RepID=A0A6B2M2K2_9BACT|nr:cardiolipin synthase [Oceanipulchritudo coccoides]NDV63178.1 cardiolipin synthase [Oceanipulchritudo coccoides]
MEGTLWQNSLAVALFAMQLMGFILAARVILSDRSTHGTIAWVLSLILLPIAAVPVYILLGRNRISSYIQVRRRVDQQFERHHTADPAHPEGVVDEKHIAFARWQILEDLAKVPLTQGNSVNYHFKGVETYASIMDGLERAKDYILFQFFIFRDDEEGRPFVDLLKKRAKEGIKVYFLVDAIGSRGLPKAFFSELEQAGIKTGVFIPGRSLRGRLRLNFRNHRKIVVIDGKEAWLGGNNIGIEYTGKSPVYGPWRDTHVHVMGPVVNAIQLTFLEDWFWVTRTMPSLDWDAASAQPENARALCLPTGPADPGDNCTLAYVHMINQAQHRLWIQSPYFVPSEEIIVALQLATLRGVDVKILLPGKFDKWLVWISSFYFSSLSRLDKVRFFRYKEGFFHSKMLLVDDELVSVGTVNFDNRSFRINFEISLILQDSRLVQLCHEQMEQDFHLSVEDPVDPLATRSLMFRLAAHGIRLLAPLL